MLRTISKMWSKSAATPDTAALTLGNPSANPASKTTPTYLPDEVWEKVFGFLSPRDLAGVAGVSRDMRRAADSRNLWQRHALSLNVRAGAAVGKIKFMCWQAETTKASLLAERQPARHVLKGSYSAVDWSPDSSKIAATKHNSSGQMSSVVFDELHGQAIGCIEHPRSHVCRAWNHIGSKIAFGGLNEKIIIMDTETISYKTIESHLDSIACLRWSPDDTKLLSASEDGQTRISNVASGGEDVLLCGSVAQAELRPYEAGPASWSPSGHQVAWVAADTDARVRVSSPVNGNEVFRVAHASRVTRLSWSPDGSRLVSASNSGVVLVADGLNGAEVARLAPGGLVTALAWRPDGTDLVSLFT